MLKDSHMHIQMTTMRKYIAMALAGTPDLEAGTFVTMGITVAFYYLSLLDSFHATLFALCFGAFCALLPDILDFFWFLSASKGKEAGDHHDRFSHSPLWILIMGCVGFLLGGPYYATIGALCLLWHFIHDSWLGDSPYFNWLNPIGKNNSHTLPVPLLVWLQNWLQPTNRSTKESVLGAGAVFLALFISGFPILGMVVGLGHILFCLTFWSRMTATIHIRA